MSEPSFDPVSERVLPYRPALDGLRGVAILLVLGFHAFNGVLGGGFLGVDLFFVLSGFLITLLLLTPERRLDVPALLGFWAGRMRRLVPALVVAAIGAALLVRFAGPAFDRDLHRSHLVSGVLYVANWVLAGAGVQYNANTGDPDPFGHLWSIAVEEQFYLVWPLVLAVVVLGFGLARRWSVTAAAAGVGALVSFGLMAFSGMSGSLVAAYYLTPYRVGALLLGALVAALVASDRLGEVPSWVAGAGWGVLAAGVLLLRTGESLYYMGGGLVVALGAALLVVGAWAHADSVSSRVLSWSPLRFMGRISYAAYLWSLPLLVLGPHALSKLLGRTVTGPVATVVSLALVLVLASASYVLIERPVRSSAWLRDGVPAWMQVVGGLVVTASTAVLVSLLLVAPSAAEMMGSVPTPGPSFAPSLSPSGQPGQPGQPGPSGVPQPSGSFKPDVIIPGQGTPPPSTMPSPMPSGVPSPTGTMPVANGNPGQTSLVDDNLPGVVPTRYQCPEGARVCTAAEAGKSNWWACPGVSASSNEEQQLCAAYEPSGTPALTVAVIGDSTARSTAVGLAPVAARNNWKLLLSVHQGCAFFGPQPQLVEDNTPNEIGKDCERNAAERIQAALDAGADVVVASADTQYKTYLDDGVARQPQTPEYYDFLSRKMAATWKTLSDAGVGVVTMLPAPHALLPDECPENDVEVCSGDFELRMGFSRWNDPVRKAFTDSLSRTGSGVQLLDIQPLLCPDGVDPCRQFDASGVQRRWDRIHPTIDMEADLGVALEPLVKKAAAER